MCSAVVRSSASSARISRAVEERRDAVDRAPSHACLLYAWRTSARLFLQMFQRQQFSAIDTWTCCKTWPEQGAFDRKRVVAYHCARQSSWAFS